MSRRALLLATAAAVVLLAAGLRNGFAADVRDGLWGDEVQELGILRSSNSIGHLLHLLERDGNPPLHYLLLYPVRHASDGAHRAIHMVLGVAAVAAMIALAWRAFGATCGLLCGLFLATGPFFIYYATEVRVYPLFLLLSILFAGAFLRFLHRPTWRTATGWGAATAVLAYCHYYAFHMAFAAGIFALVALRRKQHLVVLAGGVGALLYAPWLPVLIDQMGQNLTLWHLPTHDTGRLLDAFRLAFGDYGIWVVIFCLWRSALYFIRRRAAPGELLSFLGLLAIAVGGTALAWTVQLFQGPFIPRYVIGMAAMVLPSACLLFGHALEGRRDELRSPLGTFVFEGRNRRAVGIALILTALVIQRVDSRVHWGFFGDWLRAPAEPKRIAAYVEEREADGDLVWFAFGFDGISFCHYYRGRADVILNPDRGCARFIDWADQRRRLGDDDVIASLWGDLDRCLAAGRKVFLVAPAGYPKWPRHIERTRAWRSNLPTLFRLSLDRYNATLKRLHARGRLAHYHTWPNSHMAKQILVFEPRR